ncbi:hypothetical protein WG915_09290 [Corynebacterium sp. H128]
MTFAFAGMFAAFILASTFVPDWLLIVPGVLILSEIALKTRQERTQRRES